MIITIGNKKRILGKLGRMEQSILRQIIEQNPDELLHMPSFATMLAMAGIERAKKDGIQVAEVEDKTALIENAIEHNKRGLEGSSTLLRPYLVLSPLRSIDTISANMKSLKVLTVGPRTEAEIYALVSIGFDPANIRGLDLLSYSDFVDVGDMHAMPYPDDSFDVLIASFVLAYSRNQEKAASEFIRVLRPGGIVVVGCEYTPLSPDELRGKGSDVSDAPQFKTCQQIWDLFDGAVDEIYFKHDIQPAMQDQPGGLVTVFSVSADQKP